MTGENSIHPKKYKCLLVCALAAFVATLDASIVNLSLPTLSRHFSVSIDLVAWVVLSYTLTITATLLLAGRLAVRKGYAFAYSFGFGFFTFGSLLAAISDNVWLLIGSRIIQGLGASFLMASGPALITRAFPVRERGRAIGIIGTAVGAGLMSGPPLGGFIISAAGWPVIFLINIPIGLFGIVFAAKILKALPPDDPHSKIDIPGGAFQALAVICLLFFLNRLNASGWSPIALYSLLIAAILSVVLFLWREGHTDHPLLGLNVFSHRQFTLALIVSTIAFVSISSCLVLIPFYLEEILHLIPRQVGLVLVTIPVCMLVTAPIAGRISDAIGYRLLTTLGLAIFVSGIFGLRMLDQSSSGSDVVYRLIVIGVGLGIFQTPNATAMMSAVPRKVIGIASSILAVGRNLGLGIGVAISTAVFAYRRDLIYTIDDSSHAFVASFHWVVTAFGLFAIAAVVISIFRKNRIPAPDRPAGAGE